MPVKIRLTRMGKKKQPTYRVVVVDSRKPRDGAHIEQIGRYDPRQEPSIVEIDNDRALKWLQDGAQPTERARKLLEISGAWARFRVARGDIHTIEEAPPPLPPAPTAVESSPAMEAPVDAESAVDEDVPSMPSAAPAEAPVEPESATEEPASPEIVADEAIATEASGSADEQNVDEPATMPVVEPAQPSADEDASAEEEQL